MSAYLLKKDFDALMKEMLARRAEKATKRKAKRKELFGNARALTKTELKAKLWSLVSFYVRLRDRYLANGKCLICRANPIEVAYHIIPANEGSAAKWDFDENIVGACSGCNLREVRFRRRVAVDHRKIFGDAYIDRLEAKAKTIVKYSELDYHRMTAEVREKIRGLTCGSGVKPWNGGTL